MDNSKLSFFQIAVMGTFVVFAAAAIFTFAIYSGSPSSAFQEVVIWGTVDDRSMKNFLQDVGVDRNEFREVEYVQKNEETFEEELTEAIAEGVGPDLFILSEDQIVSQQAKIVVIPYETISEREFKDTFIEEGELLLTEEGILGFPLYVDPMVMYWNRDIFSREGLATPPQYWDEFFDVSQRITKYDEARNIEQSAVALGEFQNIDHAHQLFSTLLIQAEMPITEYDEFGELLSVLDDKRQFSSSPTISVLRFYTEFANPVKGSYSWNRSFKGSKDAFLNGQLALYFGFASEAEEIEQRNPNLNFDIALLPQVRDARRNATYGRLSSLAIPKGSKNVQGAFFAAQALTEPSIAQALSLELSLPSARRDLLLGKPQNAFEETAFSAALIARSWLDPDVAATKVIFREMVESVTSGREVIDDAVRVADRQLQKVIEGR